MVDSRAGRQTDEYLIEIMAIAGSWSEDDSRSQLIVLPALMEKRSDIVEDIVQCLDLWWCARDPEIETDILTGLARLELALHMIDQAIQDIPAARHGKSGQGDAVTPPVDIGHHADFAGGTENLLRDC